MEPSAAVTLVLVLFAVAFIGWLLSRWIVNVGPTQIAITERRYFGKELAAGRVFATAGEVGVQAAYLNPGLHFIPWPFVSVIRKVDFISIGPDELGVVTAVDGDSMPSGRVFAEDKAGQTHDNFQNPVAFLTQGGVRGKQLRFLTNGTYKIHPMLFHVELIEKIRIPEGSIGVVTATDGLALEHGQLLGRGIEGHDNFQKAEIFLKNSGQKGPQTDFLRPGTYNVFTDMFNVAIAKAVNIAEDQIGLVDAKDGVAMAKEDVVARTPDTKLHNSYQDAQAFLDQGGMRGPQEAVLRPGRYYVNPFLFAVNLRPLTVIKQGEVGVLISNIGKDPGELGDETDQRAHDSKQLTVVPEGYRGIQRNVLGPGKYNLNPLAYTVVVVPTTTRSVEWSKSQDAEDPFDPFTVISHDGFEMQVEVRCQYRVLPENAPYVIQKLGSIEDLENNVIHPQIDGIFRAQVSKSPAISYQQNRAEEQASAEQAVRDDLHKYRVEVVSVMITNIHLPEALMKTTQQKNLAEQEQSMFDAKKKAEERRIEFEKTKSQADQQGPLMKAQVGIEIADHEAKQAQKRAEGEAARIRTTAAAEALRTQQIGDAEAGIIRAKGEAQAKAYRDQVEALTAQGVTAVEVMKAVAGAGLKITPDVMVAGGGESGNSGGLVQLMLANLVQQQRTTAAAPVPPTPPVK
ncbi:MAG: SPFH domain-containing protein [Archangium sp.]